jgi:hypothetical protein
MTNPYDGIEKLSPSMTCAAKTVFATLNILKEARGELHAKEVMALIPKKIDLAYWKHK